MKIGSYPIGPPGENKEPLPSGLSYCSGINLKNILRAIPFFYIPMSKKMDFNENNVGNDVKMDATFASAITTMMNEMVTSQSQLHVKNNNICFTNKFFYRRILQYIATTLVINSTKIPGYWPKKKMRNVDMNEMEEDIKKNVLLLHKYITDNNMEKHLKCIVPYDKRKKCFETPNFQCNPKKIIAYLNEDIRKLRNKIVFHLEHAHEIYVNNSNSKVGRMMCHHAVLYFHILNATLVDRLECHDLSNFFYNDETRQKFDALQEILASM